ncbi:putative phosphatase regulatory subunit-domain-containing protein [Sporodiniella umbellata]|nr:putative phosphatase regulatory subunit-domain-containing protein [Sporodiniella umbellata]
MSTLCRKRIVLKRSVPYQPLHELPKKKKSVSFKEPLEEVVYFDKAQPPQKLLQKEGSMASLYRLTKTNWVRFSLAEKERKVRMEQVELKDGDDELTQKDCILLAGQCRASNLAYEKLVSVRYTLDAWCSYKETTAGFKESIPNTSWDRFVFSFPIQTKEVSQTIQLVLRYSVNGQEYWDNNLGSNYTVVITPPLSQKQTLKPLLSRRYDFDTSLISPPPSPPIMTPPPVEYTLPSFAQQKDPLASNMTYTDFVNKYCFYNSTSPIYSSTATSALFT